MRRSWNPGKSYRQSIDLIGGECSFRASDKISMSINDFELSNEDDAGYHSPCIQGSISPAVQGRSVREFKDQMAALRKENFNLKLRLFLVEESIQGYRQISKTSDGQDTLMKQLIDNQVEMEILRTEIDEKYDLLQDAARAISHMENLLRDTEIRHQEELYDIKQKLNYYEEKYEMDKSQNMADDFLGRSEMAENLNALQRIRELEDLLRETGEKLIDFQSQISKLDGILLNRDETIRECDDKVKKLVFQNKELLETSESKDKDAVNIKRSISDLLSVNTQLKAQNERLSRTIEISEEHFNKEITCIKTYEKKLIDQQDALAKMQSILSIKTAKTAQLLECIQDYEKQLTKMNMERKIVKREKQLFRVIIQKLQMNYYHCYSFEEEALYPTNFIPQTLNYKENFLDLGRIRMYDANCPQSPKLQNSCQDDYKFQQKLSVKFCSSANCHQHHPTLNYNRSSVNLIFPTYKISLAKQSSLLKVPVVDDCIFQNPDADVPSVSYNNNHT